MISKFNVPQKEYELNVEKFICNKFGLAEFLAKNFSRLELTCKKVLDVGCGAFPIGIFLSDIYGYDVTGVELNTIACDCGFKNIKKYKVEDKTRIENKNFIDYLNENQCENYDLIIANPPVDDSVTETTIKKYASNNFKIFDDEIYAYLTNSWHSRSGKDLTDYIFEYAEKGLNPTGVIVLVFCEIDCRSPDYIYKKAESHGFNRKEIIEGFITPESVGIENYNQKEIKTYITKFGIV